MHTNRIKELEAETADPPRQEHMSRAGLRTAILVASCSLVLAAALVRFARWCLGG